MSQENEKIILEKLDEAMKLMKSLKTSVDRVIKTFSRIMDQPCLVDENRTVYEKHS